MPTDPPTTRFLWAALSLQELKQSLLQRPGQRAGHTISPEDITDCFEGLPLSLGQVYEAYFNRLMSGPNSLLVRYALSWLIYALQPLEIAELLDILKDLHIFQEPLSPSYVEQSCQPFVVVDTSGSFIRLAHISMLDYVKLRTDKLFSTGDLALQCVLYLYHVYIEGQSKISVSPTTFPFIRHAWKYWGAYVRQSDADNGLRPVTMKLLNSSSFVQNSGKALFEASMPQLSNDEFQTSALHLACFFGINWAISSILEGGADPSDDSHSMQDSLGRTPLHLASYKGFSDCVALVLPGLSVSDVDNQGMTPLHYAIRGGHLEIVKMLIDHGGSQINNGDTDGKTPVPVVYAAEFGQSEVVALLMQVGEIPTAELERALAAAIKSRQLRTTRDLLLHVLPKF